MPTTENAARRNTSTPSSSSASDGWDLSHSAPLPTEELAERIHAYKSRGCIDSRNAVIESHLRLVAKAARRMSGRSVSFDDLMTEGSIALIRALENYDPSHGVSFTSYASAVVEHTLRGAANGADALVKIPSRERRRSAMRYRVEATFFAEHGRAPAATDLAKLEASSDSSIRSLPGNAHQPRPVSLDAETGERTARASSIADNHPTPPDAVEALDEADLMHKALDRLPEHAANVISLRFGLGDQPSMSAADIAKRLGTSTDDVRQTLNEAMSRLRREVASSEAA